MVGKIIVEKVFQHECGCCVYNGILYKDGETFNAATNPSQFHFSHEDEEKDRMSSSNITCIKGTLYRIEKFKKDTDVLNSHGNNNRMAKEESNVTGLSYQKIDFDPYRPYTKDKPQNDLFEGSFLLVTTYTYCSTSSRLRTLGYIFILILFLKYHVNRHSITLTLNAYNYDL